MLGRILLIIALCFGKEYSNLTDVVIDKYAPVLQTDLHDTYYLNSLTIKPDGHLHFINSDHSHITIYARQSICIQGKISAKNTTLVLISEQEIIFNKGTVNTDALMLKSPLVTINDSFIKTINSKDMGSGSCNIYTKDLSLMHTNIFANYLTLGQHLLEQNTISMQRSNIFCRHFSLKANKYLILPNTEIYANEKFFCDTNNIEIANFANIQSAQILIKTKCAILMGCIQATNIISVNAKQALNMGGLKLINPGGKCFFTSKDLHFDISQLNVTKNFCHELHLQGTNSLILLSSTSSYDIWVNTLVLSANNQISILATLPCDQLIIKRYGNVFKAALTMDTKIVANTIYLQNVALKGACALLSCPYTQKLICVNSSITIKKLTTKLQCIQKRDSEIQFQALCKTLHPDFCFTFNHNISINAHEQKLLTLAGEVVFNQVQSHIPLQLQSLDSVILSHVKFVNCKITSKDPIISHGFSLIKSVLKLPLLAIPKKIQAKNPRKKRLTK